MSAVIVQSALAAYQTTSTGNSRAVTLPAAVTAGNAVIVFAARWQAEWPSCDDGVVGAYTKIATMNHASMYTSAWKYSNHPGGTVTATVSDTANGNDYTYAVIVEISGADTTDCVEDFATAGTTDATGTDGVDGGTVTTTTADQLILSGTCNANGNAGLLSPGTGMTLVQHASTGLSAGLVEYKIQASAGDVNPRYTHSLSTYEWASVTVAIKNVAAGGTTTNTGWYSSKGGWS